MAMMMLVDAALPNEEPNHLTTEATQAKDHAVTHLNAAAEVWVPVHATVATRLLARKGASREAWVRAGRRGCETVPVSRRKPSPPSLAVSVRHVQASPAGVCDVLPTVVVVVADETAAAETRTETAPAPADFV